MFHKPLEGFCWPPMMIFPFFNDIHMVFGEYRDTIIVAHLSDGKLGTQT